jgi:DNA-binding response OmpR family regulator
VCYTLKDALEQTQSKRPDMIILDHNMPDGFGIETIASLKALHAAVKIVVISAMGNLKPLALEKGADHFIEKPISFSALEAFLA